MAKIATRVPFLRPFELVAMSKNGQKEGKTDHFRPLRGDLRRKSLKTDGLLGPDH
jgi:hypothetical protein